MPENHDCPPLGGFLLLLRGASPMLPWPTRWATLGALCTVC